MANQLFTFQKPVLSEPILSIKPLSFKDFNVLSTVLFGIPVFVEISAVEPESFCFKYEIIFFLVGNIYTAICNFCI